MSCPRSRSSNGCSATSDSSSPTTLGVPAQLELGIDQILSCHTVELLEARDLGSRERLVVQVAERWSAPERECLAEPYRALLGRFGLASLGDEPFEASKVQLAGLDPQEVRSIAPFDDVVAELAAQLCDAVVQPLAGGPRRRRPDSLDQDIGGNHLTRAQKQKREQCATPPLPYRDDALAVPHFDRAEDEVFH